MMQYIATIHNPKYTSTHHVQIFHSEYIERRAETTMPVSNPVLSNNLQKSCNNIIDDLYNSSVVDENVDASIEFVGILNYTAGVKLRMTYIDEFTDSDVDEWRAIALGHGADNLTTRVDTSSGQIYLNIEYKRNVQVSKIWILRSLALLAVSWSYHHLHTLHQERYPLPWST